MLFVVVQLRGESCKVHKAWFGVNVVESVSLRELFNDFISGSLDGQIANPDVYPDPTSFPSVAVGPNKSTLTPVDLESKVGDVVKVLGNFVKFAVYKQNEALEVNVASVNDVLMRAAYVCTEI
jgi:hypothetical protein